MRNIPCNGPSDDSLIENGDDPRERWPDDEPEWMTEDEEMDVD